MTKLSDRELLHMLRANPDVSVVTEDSYTRDAVQTPQALIASEPIRLTLPYPPSANRYWRMVRSRNVVRSMMVKSAEANKYIAAVAHLCSVAGIAPVDGDVAVTLGVYRPQRSGDLDNRIKVVLDALQGYAYHNDDQVAEIHATRHDDKDCPRVEVEISRVGGVNNG